MPEKREFSMGWVLVSMGLFLAVELFLGGFVASAFAGRYISHTLQIKTEVMLNVLSYFIGGILVGLLSPTVRVVEPACGAALAVLATFGISFFTPVHWLSFAHDRALIGSTIAFGLAVAGADLGERAAARLGNRASRDYARNDD